MCFPWCLFINVLSSTEKETDLSAVFSPKKKQWKKTLKSAAQSNSSEEKGDNIKA